MGLYDIHGNQLTRRASNVRPQDCSFFEGEYPVYSNLFDPEKIMFAYLDAYTGVLDTSKTSWFTSDFIEVAGKSYLYGQRLTSSGAVEVYTNRVVFYDADKKYISCFSY